MLAAPPIECLDLLGRLGELRDRLAPGVARDRRREHQGADRGRRDRRRAAVRRRAPDGRLGGDRVRRLERRPVPRAGRGWSCPTPTSPAGGVERVEALARACGARPLRLDAATHDRAVAAISHVPLILAVALVESVIGRPTDRLVRTGPWRAALAASGWASMTRLALGSPEMAAGIAGHERSGHRRRAARPARRDRRLDRRARGGRARVRPRSANGSGPPGTGWRTADGDTRMTRAGARPRRPAGGRRRRTVARPAHRPGRPRGGRRRDRRPRPLRAAAGHGSRSELQAGDPVPGPARRRALVPHAPHAGRRRRPAARALVDRGRRSPQSGRPRPRRRPAPRVARGAGRRLRPGVPADRPAQRRRDRRRRGPSRGRLRGRRRRADAWPCARSTSWPASFADEDAVAAVRDRLESWSELVFDALRVRARA